MTRSLLLPALALLMIFTCSSCIESSFFHSPVQGNTSAYHAVPLASDAIKSATYVNGALSIGSMNDGLRDIVYSGQAGIQRSNVVNNFRLSYGASLAAGAYHVNQYYDYYSGYANALSPGQTGSKFFGAYGLNGGISAAKRMGRRGEWRYIGIEGSLFNEFGSYYNFRKNLADSQAIEIDRKKYLGAAGITTELIFKGRSQNKFGIKFGLGSYLRRLYYLDSQPGDHYREHDDLIYFSNTYHFTFKKTTAYFQFNAATHAVHFQAGFNYRL